MKLFQLLQALDPDLQPERCKIHFAVWNGDEHPIDVYHSGRFDEWQKWQTKRHFTRPLVVSLIAFDGSRTWLFAGAHVSHGCKFVRSEGMFHYDLERRHGLDELDGRLVVRFERTGRNSYLYAEKVNDALEVLEIRPERVRAPKFPGYREALISKEDLDHLVGQRVEGWRSALSHVAGVYVIADRKTGRLYIGSATGQEGIWGRWCAYSQTGHGGNAELIELLRIEGDSYAKNFQFGILEIAGTHVDADDVLKRETYWKSLLLSRKHGYNSN